MASRAEAGSLRQLAELLSRVYGKPEALRYLLDDAGVDTRVVDWEGPILLVVRRALEAARNQDKLYEIAVAALKDRAVAHIHPELLDWMKYRPALGVLDVGDRCGGYEVLGVLGEGGMGVVYRVRHVETGGLFALKVMKPEVIRTKGARERFQREARASSSVDSGHVVRVVGAGVDPGTGNPWIAMELLEGRTLEERIVEGAPLGADEALRIVEQIEHALSAAHAAGVVHRDLKPDNVFLARAREVDAREQVKILDFGIAKWIKGAASTGSTTTLGTHFWRAPEQMSRRGKISPRTDLWSLGLMVFKMLTGRDYWRSAHDEELDEAAVVTEMLVEELEPASVRAEGLGFEGRLPEGFDAWFARCVVRDPEARFGSAKECLGGLREVLQPPPPEPPKAAPEEALPAPPVALETEAEARKSGAFPWKVAALAVPLSLIVLGGLIGACLLGYGYEGTGEEGAAVSGGDPTAGSGGNGQALTPPEPSTPPVDGGLHEANAQEPRAPHECDPGPLGPCRVPVPGSQHCSPEQCCSHGGLVWNASARECQPCGAGTTRVGNECRPTLPSGGRDDGSAPRSGIPVNIESVPAGATIYVDSPDTAVLGTTPLNNVRVPSGDHVLIFRLANHEEARLNVHIRRRRETFRATLRALAVIEISAGNDNARGATVRVDGAAVGGRVLGSTPIRAGNLQPGRHQVRAERQGYVPFEQWVDVQGGQMARVATVMEAAAPDTGSILVSAAPGAHVFLDGQHRSFAPTLLEGVAVGDHQVEIREEGAIPYIQQVTVRAGQRVTVTAP